MMRIDNYTKEYHDIIWFACDTVGHIVIASSMEGEIPAFVAEDRDRAEMLSETLCGVNAINRNRIPLDYEALARKGFYCFASKDPFDGTRYDLCAKPQDPILVEELQSEVKELLSAQRLPVDLRTCDHFYVAG